MFSTRTAQRSAGTQAQVLPAPPDTRERLLAFYRKRDELDERRWASGEQRVRGTVYALGVKRLTSGDDVFEAFGVMASAGIELSAETRTLIASLPQDWRTVCRIDPDGRVWTASLREKKRAFR